jgi:hypothetical protein
MGCARHRACHLVWRLAAHLRALAIGRAHPVPCAGEVVRALPIGHCVPSGGQGSRRDPEAAYRRPTIGQLPSQESVSARASTHNEDVSPFPMGFEKI